MSATTFFVFAEAAVPRRSSIARWLTYGSIGAADLCAFMVAGGLAVIVRYLFHAQYKPVNWLSFTPSLLIFFAVFGVVGLYPGVAVNPIEEFQRILRGSSIVFLLIIGAAFFLREGLMASRIVFVLAWIFTVVLVPLSRRVFRAWCSHQPWWGIPTVVMGEPDSGRMIFDMLEGHPRLGLRPIALLLDDGDSIPDALPKKNTVITGNLADADLLAPELGNWYAVIAMPTTGSERIKRVFTEHANRFHRVLIIPDLFGTTSLAVSARDICGILALEIEQKLSRKLPLIAKRAFDLSICALVMPIFAPVFFAVWLAVRLSSSGPVFFGQPRIGRDERPFRLWKFRTMVADADAELRKHLEENPSLRMEWEHNHKLRRDPRVTRVGRVLRKCSLDEMPQLWNVFCGDMSLVGPRPIVVSEIEKYGHIFQQYRRVTPGITGLWQISGRNNTTYERRIQIDDYYIRNWSIALDMYILLRTLKTVCFTEGAF